MVPFTKYSDLEDTSKIINERFDKKSKKMLTHAEAVVRDQEDAKKEHAEMMSKPMDMSSNRYYDDWTGSTYAENIYSYGVPKKLPEGDPTFVPPRDPDAPEIDYTPKETPEELQKAWDEKTFGIKDDCCSGKKEEKKEDKKEEKKEEKKLA